MYSSVSAVKKMQNAAGVPEMEPSIYSDGELGKISWRKLFEDRFEG